MGTFFGFLFKLFGIFCFLLLLCVAGLSYMAQNLLTSSDTVVQADAIVPLGGAFSNPLHAAELQKRGMAPTVYVGHFAQSMNEKALVDLGYELPTPEAVYVRILQEEGVANDSVRLFGQDLTSQLDEARALSGVLNVPARLIIVTTPYNVRLARMIYSDMFSNTDVMVVATPFEPLPARWWQQVDSIRKVASETAAIIQYVITHKIMGE